MICAASLLLHRHAEARLRALAGAPGGARAGRTANPLRCPGPRIRTECFDRSGFVSPGPPQRMFFAADVGFFNGPLHRKVKNCCACGHNAIFRQPDQARSGQSAILRPASKLRGVQIIMRLILCTCAQPPGVRRGRETFSVSIWITGDVTLERNSSSEDFFSTNSVLELRPLIQKPRSMCGPFAAIPAPRGHGKPSNQTLGAAMQAAKNRPCARQIQNSRPSIHVTFVNFTTNRGARKRGIAPRLAPGGAGACFGLPFPARLRSRTARSAGGPGGSPRASAAAGALPPPRRKPVAIS